MNDHFKVTTFGVKRITAIVRFNHLEQARSDMQTSASSRQGRIKDAHNF